MDVFTAMKLGSNSHRAGAIPASIEWQRLVELYEALPWDNEDDLDNVIKQLQHQQNAHNWKTRRLRTVDFEECDDTVMGDDTDQGDTTLKRELAKRDKQLQDMKDLMTQ